MVINPKETLENLGGKGFQLHKLKEIAVVPKFFVIYFNNAKEIEQSDIQKQILNYFTINEYANVSVRSSATVEDSQSASFAGVFETELNVTKHTLIHSIIKVMQSVLDERVFNYCKSKDIDSKTVKMRVVVQKMINSRVSGVCVTKESKISNSVLIEACYGLGEALVNGMVPPDTYCVDRDSFQINVKNIGHQKIMFDTSSNKPVSVPFYKSNARKLDAVFIDVSRAYVGVK
jgi:phosphoenolpyruvate synthase/pyruvate phosphate dikinase